MTFQSHVINLPVIEWLWHKDSLNIFLIIARINALVPALNSLSDNSFWSDEVMAFYLTAPCHYPNEHWLIVIEDHWYIFQFLSILKYLPFKDMLLKNLWNIGLLVWCWVISHVQTPPDGSSLFRRSSMMTSSNGNIFRVTGLLCGEFTSHGEFPAQTPVTRSFDVFFDLHRNQQLSKQWSHRWFETLPR